MLQNTKNIWALKVIDYKLLAHMSMYVLRYILKKNRNVNNALRQDNLSYKMKLYYLGAYRKTKILKKYVCGKIPCQK